MWLSHCAPWRSKRRSAARGGVNMGTAKRKVTEAIEDLTDEDKA
jgi:hypothetical protein